MVHAPTSVADKIKGLTVAQVVATTKADQVTAEVLVVTKVALEDKETIVADNAQVVTVEVLVATATNVLDSQQICHSKRLTQKQYKTKYAKHRLSLQVLPVART